METVTEILQDQNKTSQFLQEQDQNKTSQILGQNKTSQKTHQNKTSQKERPATPVARAYSAKQVISKKRKVLEFDGEWRECFGNPESNAVFFIWGQSGNGKTRFILELCKYLTRFDKVDYDSLEEGACHSMAIALKDVKMEEVEGRFRLLDVMPFEDLVKRLAGKKQAGFAVIDSVQYAGFDYDRYKEVKEKLKRKSLIFISHAQGNNPKGSTADSMRYDAGIKIHVMGYVAKIKSRYGGNKPFVIWEEGARKYWGKKYNIVKEGKYWPGEKK
jgi:hypothetical protein